MKLYVGTVITKRGKLSYAIQRGQREAAVTVALNGEVIDQFTESFSWDEAETAVRNNVRTRILTDHEE